MTFITKIKRQIAPWNTFIRSTLRRVKIFHRLILTFLILLISVGSFLTFFNQFKYSHEIRRNQDKYISLLVQNLSYKINDILSEYEALARSFYDNPQIISAIAENEAAPLSESYANNRSYIENHLYKLKNGQKHIINIQFVSPSVQYYMVEADGFRRGGMIRDLTEFYNSDFYVAPQQKNGYPVWFDTLEQTTTFYRDEQSIYGLANTLTLGVSVYSPDKRDFLGILILNIDINVFSEAFGGYQNYQDGNTFLIGEDGLLMSFNPVITAPTFPIGNNLFSIMAQQEQGIIQQSIDGQEIIISFTTVENTNILVTHILNQMVLLDNVYQIRSLCLIVLMITIIAFFIISYFVTKSISDPIKELITVIQKNGDGNWEERYHNDGNDEISYLGDKFNEMANNTNHLIQQVLHSEIRRQEIQLSWKSAQLNALLMQINPHFLYNTLDIIRWEAMYEAGGESKTTTMIEKFSHLCRMSTKMDNRTVTLESEIKHAKLYLEVINFRHSQKIQLLQPQNICVQTIYVPPYLLQPIMENAIRYAFPVRKEGNCINLSVDLSAQDVHISIEDNGCGMNESEIIRVKQIMEEGEITNSSIGLGNVHQRIKLFYGKYYGLHIDSSPGVGTKVEIVLPARHYSENIESQNSTM